MRKRNTYGRGTYPKTSKPKSSTFNLTEKLETRVPKSVAAMIDDISRERHIPVSRLIAFAIDNEFDQEVPFNYPCPLPDDYTEYMYSKECGVVLQLLTGVPYGLTRDTLVLCRRDLGIESRETMLTVIRELLDKGLIEEFEMKDKTVWYPVRLRAIGADNTPKVKGTRILDEDIRRKRRIKDEEIERDDHSEDV